MPGASLLPDRLVISAAVVLTAVLFVSDASDPVNIVKLSALLWCALAALALAAARVVRTRAAQLPVGPAPAAALLLLGAFVVAAIVAPHTPTAVYGTYGRNSGLLAYGAALLLFFLGLRVFDAGSTRIIAFGVLLAGLFTASYGLLQKLHVDAIGWNNPFNPIIAALGNPDFASAYLGIAVPVAVWAALWTGWSPVWRALSAATAVLCLVVAGISSAVQGPLAAAAGLAVVLVAWLLDQPGRLRSIGLGLLAGAAGLGVAVLVLGESGSGPAASFFSGISYRARTWYWEGALSMFRDSPVWGVGLDSYGDRWRQERPIEVARVLGGGHFSDAAHSVPLQMLAQGGLVLGLSYLLYTVVIASLLVRGLRRLRGQERLLLGGLGGSWVAYQVQSVVSIDQVPLLLAQFVLAAGVVVASGGARLREVRLPGAPAPRVEALGDRPRRRGPVLPVERTPTPVDHVLVGLVAIAALVLAWFALSPVRASRAAFHGDVALNASEGDAALASYKKAIDLQPSVSLYRTKEGELYNRAGQMDKSLAAFRSAADADPFDIGAVRTSGRLAEAFGGYVPLARSYFQRAVNLDPTNSDTVLDLAKFQLKHSGAQNARTLLGRTVALLPDDPGLWASLGDARAVLGDKAGAKQAYDRALALNPDEPAATEGLGKLSGR